MDPDAIAAGWDIVKQLGPRCRPTTPADPRASRRGSLAHGDDEFQREDTATIGEILAQVEQLTGKSRERLIAGLHVALD